MDTTSSKPLLHALRAHRLLESEQLKQLDGTAPGDAKSLARDLIQRGWLTPYQANQLLNGKGHDLVLGSYILLERLGEGGMGQVFKARHRALGRVCALKLIRKERTGSADAVKRFQREVRSAAAPAHPNIVLAYDADEIAGTHLMVMEYIDGSTDLGKLVKKRGPLPVERACEYVRQAALGLQHAHERGMVHRDIKPANLLLTRDGTLVKVLDMGLARLDQPGDDGDSSTMTQEGAIMGTPDYIAPEQALDTHTVDIRADLYSLGCTFYFLLTGRAPFPGGTLLQKLNKHQNEQPIAVEKLRPEVPPVVARVVRKLMAKRPDDRYQTPAELAEALTALGNALTAGAAPGDATIDMNELPASGSDDSLRSAFAYIEKRSDTVAYDPQAGIPKPRKRRWLVVGVGTALSALVCLAVLLLLVPGAGKQRPADAGKGKFAVVPKKVAPAKTLPREDSPPVAGPYALQFDGKSSHVVIPSWSYQGDHPLTVEAWAALDRPLDEPQPEVLLGNPEQAGFAIGAGTGHGGKIWDFAYFIQDQKWYATAAQKQPLPRRLFIHLAGVYDGKTEILFYVNGLLQKRTPATGKYKVSPVAIALGANPDPNDRFTEFFLGRVSTVRFSKVARYDADFTPQQRFEPDKDTVALYRFSEGTGEKLVDSSGNNHHGTIVGAKWVKVDAPPPIAKTPGPWQPLLDDKLGRWNFNSDLVSLDTVNGERVFRIKAESKGDGTPIGSKTFTQRFHLRLEFQTPGKGAAFAAGFGWPGGKIGGIHFPVNETGKSTGAAFGLSTNAAVIERGAIVSTGKPNDKYFRCADASLGPPGTWNRLDLVRDGDRAAFFINGRLIAAIADILGMADGKEIDLGAAGFAIYRRAGETVFRHIAVRDIAAFRPELIKPGPWRSIPLDAKPSRWNVNDPKKTFAVVEIDKEPVLQFTKKPSGYLYPKETLQDYHLRLDIQFPAKHGRFDLGWALKHSIFYLLCYQNGQVNADLKAANANRGELERGAIVSKGPLTSGRVLANADLKPAGEWNRLDLVRLGGTFALFLNGRFVGAATDLRWLNDGKEIDLGRVPPGSFTGFGVQVRRVEARDITALPPELLASGR